MRTIQRNNDVAFRILDGEAVLLNPVDNQIHLLNEVATFIWELLPEPKSEDDILSAIREEFEVEYTQVLSDLQKYSDQLLEKDLIEVIAR
ncbi:MAG: PqqD family protein [Candidatus Hatepunaea meridiana]|nr:PqqD family protein [Candidatus Hatepunaea meridiana]